MQFTSERNKQVKLSFIINICIVVFVEKTAFVFPSIVEFPLSFSENKVSVVVRRDYENGIFICRRYGCVLFYFVMNLWQYLI